MKKLHQVEAEGCTYRIEVADQMTAEPIGGKAIKVTCHDGRALCGLTDRRGIAKFTLADFDPEEMPQLSIDDGKRFRIRLPSVFVLL